MEEWKLFLERGKKDLERSQSMYNDYNDYELSSYLIQQALEKHIKAFFLKSKIVKNDELRKLGHAQLIKIMEKIIKNIPDSQKRVNNKKYLELLEIMRPMLSAIKIIYEKIIKREYILDNFMQVMGVEPTRTNMTSTLCESDLKFNKLFMELPDFESILKQFLQEDRCARIIDNMYRKMSENSTLLSEKIKEGIELLKSKNVERIIKNKDKAMELILTELKLFELLIELIDTRKFKPYMPKKTYKKLFYMWFIAGQYFELILKTLSYETIGRYPENIYKNNSICICTTDVYEQHKKNLYDLIEQVKKACNNIRKQTIKIQL